MSETLKERREKDAGSDAVAPAPTRGELLAARVNQGWSELLARAGEGAGRLGEAARELRRSPVLRHALAARQRGNLEAAFWLLDEEFRQRPEYPEVAAAYWDLAVTLERVEMASPAAVGLVRHHASAGEVEVAAQYWAELVRAAPDVLVPPTVIATILPVLRRQLGEGDTEGRNKARDLVWRAMHHAVNPHNQGLTPGLALRLFEEGRDVNPEAARRAAEVALESSDLHEAKRARLNAWMQGLDPGQATPDAPPPRPVEASAPPAPLPAAPQRRPESLSEAEVAAAAARLPPARPPAGSSSRLEEA